jgi:hypothetical protein
MIFQVVTGMKVRETQKGEGTRWSVCTFRVVFFHAGIVETCGNWRFFLGMGWNHQSDMMIYQAFLDHHFPSEHSHDLGYQWISPVIKPNFIILYIYIYYIIALAISHC